MSNPPNDPANPPRTVAANAPAGPPAPGLGQPPRGAPSEGFAPTERVAPRERFTPTERYIPPGTDAQPDGFAPTQRYVPTQRDVPTQQYAPTLRIDPGASKADADQSDAAPGGPLTAAAAAPAGNALPLGTMLAEFELVRVLGEGGFGVVYLANDHSLRREVAIKEYMPASLATRDADLQVKFASERNRAIFGAGLISFINEARLLAKFDHPSLVKVYRFWQANGTAYMVMPFYEGATLRDTLRDLGGPPDERWLMAFLGALTEALGVIHADHFLHRDIAPDNIVLLAGSGRPLLLDFGAARLVIGDATQALTAILKPGFAPVEQYAELPGLKQGPWTDVYALCAVVYTAIMGRKPPVSVGRTVRDNYLPLARNATGRYSDPFLLAIDAGLQVLPHERTASVAALRRDLRLEAPIAGFPSIAAPVPPAADRPPAPPMPPPPVIPPTRQAMPVVAPAPVRVAISPVPSPGSGAGGRAAAANVSAVRAVSANAPAAAPQPARSERTRLLRWLGAWLVVAALAALAAGVFMWSVYRRPAATSALPASTAPPATPADGAVLMPTKPAPTPGSSASGGG